MSRTITPEDLFQMVWVGDPQVSPDGRHVVYVETRVNAEKNGYESSLWLLETEGGAPRRLTWGKAPEGVTSETAPRWSPDGRSLVFQSNRSGKPRLYLLSLEGGEARPLTSEEEGVGEAVFSPDGEWLAVVLRDPEKKEEASEGERKPKPDARWIDRLRYKFNGVGLLEPERRRHLYLLHVATGRKVRLTRGDFDVQSPSFSPDGRWLVFSANMRTEDVQSWPDVYYIPVPQAPEGEEAIQEPKRLSSGKGPAYGPVFSPSGRYVLYAGHEKGDMVANVIPYAVEFPSGTPRPLGEGLDLSMSGPAGADARWDQGSLRPVWSQDEGKVFLSFTVGGTNPLFALDVKDGTLTRLTPESIPTLTSFSFSRDGKVWAFVGAHALSPGDLYVQKEGEEPRQRTFTHQELFSQLELALPTKFTFENEGVTLEAWIMEPLRREEGKKYPLILSIHGGPHTAYGEAFFHEFQLYAAQGWGVLFMNPRGSVGYGEAFTQACLGDWGGRDYRDLMAGVDEALRRFPWIDSQRLAVTGGSYGGYMTNWIITQTTRFKVAITDRSISNLYSMYGTSDIGFHFNRRELGDADLWADEEKIMERSPIRYLPQVETPLLIVHSDQDLRCPIEQAEQLYIALKVLGKKVAFLRFSGENHELSRSGKPLNRLERLKGYLKWFREHLEEGGD
ncbi:MAG: S9 family peptidase [Clostridiales bacterium]|nr:S9 family peptidase [Clostridiales bacterium]